AVAILNILSLTVVSAAAPPMSFDETVITLDAGFSVPQDYAVADLDHVNGPDIVVMGHHADLAVLLHQGNGTFSSPQYIDSPCEGFASAHTFAVGQFSSDGNPDILVACENKNSDGFKRLLGHGDGTFADPETMAPILTDVGGLFGDVERMQLGTYGNASGQTGTGLQSIVFTSSFAAGTGVTFLCFVPVTELVAGFDSSTPVIPHCSVQFDPDGNLLAAYTITDTYVLASTPFTVSE